MWRCPCCIGSRRMRILLRVWLVVLLVCVTTSMYLLAASSPSCPNDSVFSLWSLGLHRGGLCATDPRCTLPPLITQPQKTRHGPPTVHISVVACGDRLEETLVMIKSAVIISFSPLHFHIFADDELRPQFKNRLSEWPSSVRSKFSTSIYPITYPPGEDAETWKNLFKPCATQRLFIPYVIPENATDALLYVDTDILFMRPVEHIWNFFHRFNSSHIAALAPEHEWDRQGWYNRFARHPYYGPTGVNSGVMLMNLTRMREAKWIEHIIPYYKEYRLKITWGDQDLINIFFHYFPDKLYVYPCHWNFRPDHCMYGLNCVPAKERGVSVVHGCRGVYHDEKQPVFKAVYHTFRDYKFGSDLASGLLDQMRESIEKVKTSGYCGQAAEVFTAQLDRQLQIREEKCDKNTFCDIDTYQPEDFSLEQKPTPKADKKKKSVDKKKSQKKAESQQTETQGVKKTKKNTHKQDKKLNQGNKQTDPRAHNAISESLIYEIIDTLLDEFQQISSRKLLPILTEHLIRAQDALERHRQPIMKPQENQDEALLSGQLHEEMLGFLMETFDEMDSGKDYVSVLEQVVKHLQKENVKEKAKQKDGKKKEVKQELEEEMHVAVVACGERLEEPLVMMKSALIFSRKKLRFHLFAEKQLQTKFRERVASWPDSVRGRMELIIHNIQYPAGQNEADWKKLFKMCATQRLFIPDLLKDVDSLLYVDTDILFLRPVDDIWDKFAHFNSSHISGLAPEHEDAHVSWYKRFARHPYYPPLGVNSGVMLMNLTRMREAKWIEHIVPYYHTYRYNTTWGDQDLINIFFHFFPKKLYIFPCDWNYRQDHCMYMHVCKLAEKNGVSVLHGARGVYHNEKERAFRAVYEAIRDYPFGSDLKTELLDILRSNVDSAAKTNCGKVGWVLSKQLEEQIKLKQGNKR